MKTSALNVKIGIWIHIPTLQAACFYIHSITGGKGMDQFTLPTAMC